MERPRGRKSAEASSRPSNGGVHEAMRGNGSKRSLVASSAWDAVPDRSEPIVSPMANEWARGNEFHMAADILASHTVKASGAARILPIPCSVSRFQRNIIREASHSRPLNGVTVMVSTVPGSRQRAFTLMPCGWERGT